VAAGRGVSSSAAFACFLKGEVTADDFRSPERAARRRALDSFSWLDDSDILSSIKDWITYPDLVLSELAARIVNRKLMKIKISPHPFGESQLGEIRAKVGAIPGIAQGDAGYFISIGEMTNKAYQPDEEAILILYKNGKLKDIRDASDINLEGLTKTVRKHFVCYPAKISQGN
jgi:hypothetical protein